MNIYPTIKPSTWAGFQQTEQEFLVDPVLDDPTVGLPLPKIVYAVDQDDSMIYVEENFFEGKSDAGVKHKAYADLRQHLAETDWQTLDMNDKCEGLSVLVMQTDYYGSEVLLLKERMQEAASQLNSKRLLACTPYRGVIFVLPFDIENKSAVEVFLAVCYENYHQPVGDQLSDIVWTLEDGEVKGVMDVGQEFKQYHQNQYIADHSTTTDSSDINSPINSIVNAASAATVKQFSITQIGIAAFVATPLAGFLLIASNLKSIGSTTLGNVLSVMGVLLMPLILYVYTIIPAIPYEKLFPAVSAISSVALAKILLKSQEGTIIERQGLLALLGQMLLALLIVFGMLMVLINLMPEQFAS